MKPINEIINGNNIDILYDIDREFIDLIFTSPQYNFDIDYESTKDKIDYDLYLFKLFNVFQSCFRVLKSDGRFVINIQPNYRERQFTHVDIVKILDQIGFKWFGEIIWRKQNIKKVTAWGSWKSPSCPYINNPYEYLFIFYKYHRKKQTKGVTDLTKEEFIEYVNGIWTIAPAKPTKELTCPAQFPEELAKRVIKLFTWKDDIVLDPFNGSGTTTYVANKLGRKYIGIDISNKYCDEALNRL